MGSYFLVIDTAEVLSHVSGVASIWISSKSFNTNLNQIAEEVASTTITYSASAIDNATLCYLRETQENIP